MEEQLKQQGADIVVIRSELVEIRKQVSQLTQRVTNLENVLN